MKTITDKLMVSLILVVILVTLFSCCKSLIPPDDKLTLPKQSYDGNELRIDGYYYHLNYTKEEGYYDTYFLYKNGIILYIGTVKESLLQNDLEQYVERINETKNNSKTRWGAFIIQESLIKFERWYPSSPYEPTPTYISEGRILNDTTFHITKSYRSNGSEFKERDELYHFRKFSPKPDSTNVFVKQ